MSGVPLSLPEAVVSRLFIAANGEFGVPIEDVTTFLNACETDHIDLLGWELWLVDHMFDPDRNELIPAPGRWTGLFPDARGTLGVWTGVSGLSETRRELEKLDWNATAGADMRPFLRVNFSLDD